MKTILKSLQIAILCGSILNLQNIALAQDLGAQISTTVQTSSASSTSASAGNATTIAAIKNDSNMMSSITMLVIGLVASQLFKYKPKTADILLAIGGGAAFIGGEIMSTNSFKDLAEDLEVPSGNPDAAQIESLKKLKESYEEAKKTTNTKKMLQMAAAGAFGVAGITAIILKSKEVAVEKAYDASLAGVAASASAAAAAASASCSSGNTSSCAEATTANQIAGKVAKLQTDVQASRPVDEATTTNSQTKETAYQKQIKKEWSEIKFILGQTQGRGPFLLPVNQKTFLAQAGYNNVQKTKLGIAGAYNSTAPRTDYLSPNNTAGGQSLAEAAGFAQAPQAASTPTSAGTRTSTVLNANSSTQIDNSPAGSPAGDNSLIDMYNNPTPGPPAWPGVEYKLPKNILKSIANFVFPPAYSATMSLLMGGAGIALGAVIKPIGAAIDKFIHVPRNRAIVWGVLAGLSFAASSASGKTVEQLDENIKKIDGILKPIEANAPGTTTPNGSSTPVTTTWFAPLLMSLISSAHANTPQNQTPVYRLGNGKERMSCLDKAGEKNCSSLKSYAAKMPIFNELSPGIKSHVIDVLTMSDGLNGTVSFGGASLIAANRLAANQPAIAKTFESYKNNLNNILAKDKRPQIDFKKEESRALNYFNNETAKVLQRNKVSPTQFLASVNPALLRGAMDASKSASDFSYSPVELTESDEAEETEAKVANRPSQNAYIPRDTSNMGNTHFDDKPLPKKEYDIGSNDINTDKNSSIFDVISSRYIKSYNKLQD